MVFLDISAGCADFMYNVGSELYEMLHRADMELYNARKIRRESVIRPDRK
jgi:PleD family two-component response regulator